MSEFAGLPLQEPTANGGTPPLTPWPPAPPSEFVQAANVVVRAIIGRIGTLQAEIDALKRAVQPFQQLGKQNQDVLTTGGDDAVSELLAIARKLGGSSTP